jgi:hypothetical protein
MSPLKRLRRLLIVIPADKKAHSEETEEDMTATAEERGEF